MSPSTRSRKRGERTAIAAVSCAVALIWLSSQVFAGRADYVGAQMCKTCHQSAYDIWRNTAHARADTSIGRSPSPACLACHTTGDAPASRRFLAAVQCEACHGPGAGYADRDIMRDPALARRLGLRDLSTPAKRAALCLECHNAGTSLVPFDPETAYQQIRHE